MPSELRDIEVNKISLVGSPANEREFLLFKSEDGVTATSEDVDDVEDVDREGESLTKTLTRLLTDEEREELIKELQEQTMSDADADQQNQDAEDVDKDVQEDDVEPETQDDVQKAEEQTEAESDTAEDVDTSEFVKAERVEELEKRLERERDKNRRREFIEKAEEQYPSLPGTDEDKGELLKSLDEQLDNQTYDAVTDVFDRVQKVLSEADLFKSFGQEDTDNRIDLKKEAAKRAAEQDISRVEAMRQVRKENPELIQ